MKIRKLAAFLLIGMLLCVQGISVYAQAPPNKTEQSSITIPGVQRWSNVNDIRLSLYFENGDACCTGLIRGVTGVTRIDATFTLEKKVSSGWSLENTWYESSDSSTLSFFGTHPVSSGTYKLSVTADVTRDGFTETVSTSVQSIYSTLGDNHDHQGDHISCLTADELVKAVESGEIALEDLDVINVVVEQHEPASFDCFHIAWLDGRYFTDPVRIGPEYHFGPFVNGVCRGTYSTGCYVEFVIYEKCSNCDETMKTIKSQVRLHN